MCVFFTIHTYVFVSFVAADAMKAFNQYIHMRQVSVFPLCEIPRFKKMPCMQVLWLFLVFLSCMKTLPVDK